MTADSWAELQGMKPTISAEERDAILQVLFPDDEADRGPDAALSEFLALAVRSYWRNEGWALDEQIRRARAEHAAHPDVIEPMPEAVALKHDMTHWVREGWLDDGMLADGVFDALIPYIYGELGELPTFADMIEKNARLRYDMPDEPRHQVAAEV